MEKENKFTQKGFRVRKTCVKVKCFLCSQMEDLASG